MILGSRQNQRRILEPKRSRPSGASGEFAVRSSEGERKIQRKALKSLLSWKENDGQPPSLLAISQAIPREKRVFVGEKRSFPLANARLPARLDPIG
jgi:hypothetical protein